MNHSPATDAVSTLRQVQLAAERGIAEGLRATSRLVDLAAQLDEQIKRMDERQSGSQTA